MTLSGISNLLNAKLNQSKKKGKAFSKELADTFSPENILEVNEAIGKGSPDAGLLPKKKKNGK